MFLVELLNGGGGATAAVLTLGTATDESTKDTAKGVASFLNQFCRSDGHPCYYRRLEYDVIFFRFSLPSCFFLVSPFVSFSLPAVRMPVSSPPSCCFVRAAAIWHSGYECFPYINSSLFYLLVSFVFCFIPYFFLPLFF